MTSRPIIVLLLASGCLKSLGPDDGTTNMNTCQGAACPDAAPLAGCNDVDSNPNQSVSFNVDIMNGLFVRYKCKSCHTGGGDGKQDGKLDMASYATLRVGGARSGANVIVNNMPCQSIIVQKVSPTPPFGRRMPRDGAPYLSTADDLLLRDWIFEGANEN